MGRSIQQPGKPCKKIEKKICSLLLMSKIRQVKQRLELFH